MDDIQGKLRFMKELQSKGITGDALQEALEQYDLMDEEQQANALAAVAQLHVQGSVPVPEKDQQDNRENTLAASRIRAGTYDPERDNYTPEGMRSEVDKRMRALHASLGMEDSGTSPSGQIEERAKKKPVVERSSLIVKGSSSVTLRPPKVKP